MKLALLVGGGVLAGLLVGLAAGRAIWRPAESWRYISGPQGVVYRIHNQTGETWWTVPSRGWVRVADPRNAPRWEDTQPYSDLPAGAVVENK